MAQSGRPEAINYEHLAHIIRDVFNPHGPVILYGTDHELITTLRKPEHGIEAWRLYTDAKVSNDEHSFNWLMEYNDSYFGFDYAELFISFGYSPSKVRDPDVTALQVARLLKPGGLALVAGFNRWAVNLSGALCHREDLVDKLEAYSFFRNKGVQVLQR